MRNFILWFFTAVFLLFAGWQYNDPDPIRWASMYGFVALAFGLAASKRYLSWLYIIGMLASGLWMALLLPDFINWIKMGMPTITGSMKAESPHVEFTREFLGLLICFLGLSSLLWLAYRSKSKPA